jgi:CRISPR-associated protein Csb1
MSELTIERLVKAVDTDAAVRRRRWLQPTGGRGDKLFPPTYPGPTKNDPPRHVFERRQLGNEAVLCVLLDSVPSQANRLEAALLSARDRGALRFPTIAVDFRETDIDDVGVITALDAPHRFTDAILRDSLAGTEAFRRSPEGERLFSSSPADARAVYEIDPSSLNHGAWNSNGGKGISQTKFARAVCSEIVGVGVATEDGKPSGTRTSSRIDPLGIVSAARVFKLPGGDWSLERPGGVPEKHAGDRPSERLHGNIKPSLTDLGVSVEYAMHTFVYSCSAARKLRFPKVSHATASYARASLLALELAAAISQDMDGYFLRSRCDLVPVPPDDLRTSEDAPSGVFELVHADGTSSPCEFDFASVCKLVANCAGRAAEGGLRWHDHDLLLRPQPKLVELVKRSRQHALQTEGVDQPEED